MVAAFIFFMNGIFAVYKPKGPTSHDIINLIRKKTGIKKVGHAGTLDPLARGVLVIGVGREATKNLNQIVRKEKEYLAEIKLGQYSATDDEEGEKTKIIINHQPKRSEIIKALKLFQGQIKQTPPIFSAVKIKGQAAYRSARRGQVIKLKPRLVEIKSIRLISYSWPKLKLRVITGPGVYIRSLARDLGGSLGVGGYLSDLERIRVGDFSKDQAKSFKMLK